MNRGCSRCQGICDEDIERIRAGAYDWPAEVIAGLSGRQYEIAKMLGNRPGRFVSVGYMATALMLSNADTRTLIWRLRKRLPEGYRIENRATVGYRLVVDIEALTLADLDESERAAYREQIVNLTAQYRRRRAGLLGVGR